MDGNTAKDLQNALPEGTVLTGREELLCYGSDSTRAFAMPDAVVRPADATQVRAIMNITKAHGTAVVPRGAGTGLSGGCVPSKGGVVIASERLNRIIEIDPAEQIAVVEPGVVTAELDAAARALGLFYPPDPSSFRSCTIGGNIAENAGGLRGLKYGVTRDFVMALNVILPDGREMRTGSRTVKNATGYDMTRLIVGSEGTLGFITQAVLKLIPLPETKASFLAGFDTLEAAAGAVVAIIKSGVTPSTLEIMDEVTLSAVKDYTKADGLEYAAMLLIEVDGSGPDVARQSERLTGALAGSGVKELVREDDHARQERLWSARRSALTALARISPSVILEDATVPRRKIPDMVRAIQKAAAEHSLLIGTFGHAGDGNLHPTIITDLRVPENRMRVEAAVEDIFHAAIQLGGTLSGEHGIGIMKAPFLESEIGADSVAAMRAVKDALDPAGTMNPGKIFV
ncbi:MAG TPA: FAD-linked oxidase C-terminal domain-containing protein [Nitrospirota bacterium]